MADTRASEEFIQIKDLSSVTTVKDSDLFMLDDGTTDEKKATIGDVKAQILDSVDTKLEDYSTTEEMNEAIEASSPKVSKKPGNVVEMETDGLYVSEDISGKVESFTQEAYDELPEAEKNDGKIREITDAPGNEIPFVILDDTINTASNVLSAQKVNELFGYELGQNENGKYLKCANGLLLCWGTIASREVTLPSQYKDIEYCVIPRSDGSAYGLQILTKNIDSMVLNNYQNAYQGEYFAIGFWK